jgi:protoheme IX farnesyltransferase|tara:strand:+ start:883 stop:1770 length:888 start_codon:yes stop_codon:yes gene_type:complete
MKRRPLPAKNIYAAFIELTKPRITFLILVSTALGYYLGNTGQFELFNFLITIIGTTMLAGGAGAINHYIEKDLDMLMERTKSRPIPAGLISSQTALYFGIIQSVLGFGLLLAFVNMLTALLGLLTIVLYIFVYTPLKMITWLNTTIGAVPGALPALGGWAASANELNPNAWILFAILFLWQHPHFYAIALMCKEDYKKAGFKMLPVIEEDNNRTNRQIIWHAFLLIPVSLFFVVTGVLGSIYFWGAAILGAFYLLSGIPLLRESSVKNAKLLLRTSVLYLPLLLVIILIDLNYSL